MTGIRSAGRLRVGLVGCGAIGSELARALAGGAVSGARLVGLCDLKPDRARRLAAGLRPKPPALSLRELARRSDLLVEAAGQSAVPAIAAAALAATADLLVMSVGALLAHPELARRFARAGRRLLHPSGAVAGLDGLRCAASY